MGNMPSSYENDSISAPPAYDEADMPPPYEELADHLYQRPELVHRSMFIPRLAVPMNPRSGLLKVKLLSFLDDEPFEFRRARLQNLHCRDLLRLEIKYAFPSPLILGTEEETAPTFNHQKAPEAMALFVKVVDEKLLARVDKHKSAYPTIVTYTLAYLIATILGGEEICNLFMDAIIEWYDVCQLVPNLLALSSTLEMTTGTLPKPLEKFFVDMFVSSPESWTMQMHEPEWWAMLGSLQQPMLKAMAVKDLNRDMRFVGPMIQTRCAYHVHDETVSCRI